jgi:hypothetical protein
MSAAIFTISNNLLNQLALANMDFDNDAFRIILMNTGFTFDPDNHNLYSDVSGSELPAGNGYSTTGLLLTGVNVTRNDTTDQTEITWNNAQWTAGGGPIGPSAGALLYKSSGGAVVGFGTYTDGDKTAGDLTPFTVGNINVVIGRNP